MNNQDRCMQCMKETKGYDVCMHCGWIIGSPPEISVHIIPGTLLVDRYLIGVCLGYGGFGITYRAWDTKLNIQVAVKEYFPNGLCSRIPGQVEVASYSGDKQDLYLIGLKRFLEEARNLARFSNHPNIVHVVDYFSVNNSAYIVMEYLDGMTLRMYLQRKGDKLTADQAISIVQPICNALQSVHEAGIIHRDISPDNIFVTSDDQIRLIDFGAARLTQKDHESNISVILKPGYAPPEQYLQESKLGPYTDLYALGATLYRIVTGIIPDESVDRMVEDTLARPSEINPLVPEYIERTILKAMALDSDLRFQNAEEFKRALSGKKLAAIPEEQVKKNKAKRKAITVSSIIMTSLAISIIILLNTVLKPEERLIAKTISADSINVWFPTTFTDSFSDDFDQSDFLYIIANQFETDNENIDINFERIASEGYSSQLQTAKKSSAFPDLFYLDQPKHEFEVIAADLSILINSMDLTEYLFIDQYSEWFHTTKFMPTGFKVPVLYQNEFLSRIYGVDLINKRISIDQTINLFSDLPSTLTGLVVSHRQLSTIAYNSNGNVLRHEIDPYTAHYSKSSAQGFYDINQHSRIKDSYDAEIDLFMQDQSICYLGDTSDFAIIQSTMSGYYHVLPAPGTKEYIGQFVDFWTVNQGSSENKQHVSMLFILYLLSTSGQDEMYLQAENNLPLNRDIFDLYITAKRPELGFLSGHISDLVFFGEAETALRHTNEQLRRMLYVTDSYSIDDFESIISVSDQQ